MQFVQLCTQEGIVEGFNVVTKRINQGYEVCRFIVDFWKQYSHIEDIYSKSLSKLLQSSEANFNKVPAVLSFLVGNSAIQEIGPLNTAWQSTKQQIGIIAQQHALIAAQMHTMVAAPIIQFLQNDTAQTKFILEGRNLLNELKKVEIKCEQDKQRLEKLKKDEDALNKKMQKAQLQGASYGIMVKLQQQLSSLQTDIQTQQAAFQQSQAEMESFQQQLLKDRMPPVLNELQVSDGQRVDAIKESLDQFAGVLHTLVPILKSTSELIHEYVQLVDKASMAEEFLQRSKPSQQSPAPPLSPPAPLPTPTIVTDLPSVSNQDDSDDSDSDSDSDSFDQPQQPFPAPMPQPPTQLPQPQPLPPPQPIPPPVQPAPQPTPKVVPKAPQPVQPAPQATPQTTPQVTKATNKPPVTTQPAPTPVQKPPQPPQPAPPTTPSTAATSSILLPNKAPESFLKSAPEDIFHQINTLSTQAKKSPATTTTTATITTPTKTPDYVDPAAAAAANRLNSILNAETPSPPTGRAPSRAQAMAAQFETTTQPSPPQQRPRSLPPKATTPPTPRQLPQPPKPKPAPPPPTMPPAPVPPPAQAPFPVEAQMSAPLPVAEAPAVVTVSADEEKQLLTRLLSMCQENDFFSLFEIDLSSTPLAQINIDVINKKRRELNRKLHPDHFGNDTEAQQKASSLLAKANDAYLNVFKEEQNLQVYRKLCEYRREYARLLERAPGDQMLKVAANNLFAMRVVMKRLNMPTALLSEVALALDLLRQCRGVEVQQ